MPCPLPPPGSDDETPAPLSLTAVLDVREEELPGTADALELFFAHLGDL
ncbi:hypothetical protein [Streptomyces sp. NPDC007083]